MVSAFTPSSAIKTLKIALLLAIAVFFVSMAQKDRLGDAHSINPALYQEPVQVETAEPVFEKTVKGVTYVIAPMYEYELNGLVVSHMNTFSWMDSYNREAKDYINTKDICVLYGDNLKNAIYAKMKYSSNSWVCYASYRRGASAEERGKFKNECLSNNHLLAADAAINREMIGLRKGDQVYLKGYLVKYRRKDYPDEPNYWRVSSTVRTDQGCETIYVTRMNVYAKANVAWNLVYALSKWVIGFCLLAMIVIFRNVPIYK